jgi:hypothetical protein
MTISGSDFDTILDPHHHVVFIGHLVMGFLVVVNCEEDRAYTVLFYATGFLCLVSEFDS